MPGEYRSFEPKQPEELESQLIGAEKLLGSQFFPNDEKKAEVLDIDVESIKNKYPYRYEKYLKLQREERSKGTPQQELISIRKYISLINNLEEYIASYEQDKPEGFLREHQQDVFHSIAEFLNKGHKAGYLDLPTGFGKTVLFVELVKALLKGRDKKTGLKTLVLVPTQDLVTQTIGKNENQKKREGFAKFAPDINVTAYYEEVKDLRGEVVVSTYQSFIRLQKENPKFTEQFEVVILDEAHKALGEATKEQIQAIAPNALKIGCTATSEYDEGRSVENILPELIHKMEAKEAVELGILANPRGFLYQTHIKFEGEMEMQRDGRDYPASVLRELNKEARNQVTVEFVKTFVSQSIRGLVPCLPGNRGEHARHIADKINLEKIVDPTTRKERNIIAKSITQDTPKEERDKIYEQFKSNKIDCITYIDIITTGKDLPNAKFLVRNRPRRSRVESTQEIGRLLRPYGGQDPYIVEFEDEFPTGAKPYTIFDLFQIETITQGQQMVAQENIVGVMMPEEAENNGDLDETKQEEVKPDAVIENTEKQNIIKIPDQLPVDTDKTEDAERRRLEREEKNRQLIQRLLAKMKVETRLVRELERAKQIRKVDYASSKDLTLLLSCSNPQITDWTVCNFREFNDTTFGGKDSGLATIKGTAILRGFGTGKENSKNLNKLLEFVGIDVKLKEGAPREKKKPKELDFSNPTDIKAVLLQSEPFIDFTSCTYGQFKRAKFGGGTTGFKKISGQYLVRKVLGKESNEGLEELLKFAGIEVVRVINYDNPAQLKILLSSNARIDLKTANLQTFTQTKFGGMGTKFIEVNGRNILLNFGSGKDISENYNALLKFAGIK